MAVWFDQPSWEVTPGRAGTVGFTVRNDSEEAQPFQVRLELPDPRLRLDWFELDVPGVIEAGEQGTGAVWARVPAGTLTDGEYPVQLVAVAGATRRRDAAHAVLRVAAEAPASRPPCVAFPTVPTFNVVGDGIDATVRLLNCGNADVTVRLRFRHQRGWSFGVEREVVLRLDAGPLDVQLRLDTPSGAVLRPQDRITVEVDWQGQLVAAASAAAQVRRPLRLPRRSRAAALTSLAVLAVAAALLLFNSDEPTGPIDPLVVDPVDEVEAVEPGDDEPGEATDGDSDDGSNGDDSDADESDGDDPGPLPDLVVARLGGASVTVANEGDGDAGPFVVQVGTRTLRFEEGLAAGATDTREWAPCEQGPLSAHVNPDGAVVESDVDNNVLDAHALC